MPHYTYVLYVLCEDDELKAQYVNKYTNGDCEHDGLHTGTDSGFDIFAPEKTIIPSGSVAFVNQKIKCKMVKRRRPNRVVYDRGEEIPTGFYLYPRSSISKTPLLMANSVGIIDSGYRGNIIAALRNLDSLNPHVISKHQRLVQICAPDLSPFDIVFVDLMDETSRGEGGFGSTGK